MKNRLEKALFAVLVLALTAGLGSCALFGIDGPTWLGVGWEGTGTLYYNWTFPYPFNVSDLWIPETFYEVEPDTYYFNYYLEQYGYYSLDYYLIIEAESGSFPFEEGAESYLFLDLTTAGPIPYIGNRVAAKVSEPDGSWTATAIMGGRTVTLGYKAGSAPSLGSSTEKSSKTK